MGTKVYVASSWRNKHQQSVVRAMRGWGFEVYDFRNPPMGCGLPAWEGMGGFGSGRSWTTCWPIEFRDKMCHPLAQEAFRRDMSALREAHICVCVLPSGRSAHLELGAAIGMKKHTVVYMPEDTAHYEPELMYLAASAILIGPGELRNYFEIGWAV